MYMVKYSFDIASILEESEIKEGLIHYYFFYWETVMCSTFSYTAIDKENEN